MGELRRVILTGGGTGGHVYPALAIGAALRSDETRFLYVGVRGRAESAIVPRQEMDIRYVRASAFPGPNPSPALARFSWDLALGILQSVRILVGFRPDAIVGTGGYASAPLVLAAAALRKAGLCKASLFIHEQNAAPGLLNRFVGRFADRVFLTFPEALASFPDNGVLAGYPVRSAIASVDRPSARSRLDFAVPEGRFVVFAFGGSQGARTLNRAVVDSLRDLLPHAEDLFVIHGTGLSQGPAYDASADTEARLLESYSEEERGRIGRFYVRRDYFHEIQNIYAASDLVVCRGGAGSLYEVSALGLPAVVIPKSNLPGDHQVMNARALRRAGGATVLCEETVLEGGRVIERVSGQALAKAILALRSDGEARAAMSEKGRGFMPPGAAGTMARAILGEVALPGVEALAGGRQGAAPLLSNARLLLRLTAAKKASGAAYDPASAVSDPEDLAYYKVRSASLLASPEWQARNTGIKLLGLLKVRESLPLLLGLLEERKPASALKRLLGGDFEQVGFIRRNILAALPLLGEFPERAEKDVIAALRDPYYEVRVEAARCLAHFGAEVRHPDTATDSLLSLLEDRSHEVAAEAALALGSMGSGTRVTRALLGLADHHFWQVRNAALRGLRALVQRGQAEDPSAWGSKLARFILTSTDFKPHFILKEEYRALVADVERWREKANSERGDS